MPSSVPPSAISPANLTLPARAPAAGRLFAIVFAIALVLASIPVFFPVVDLAVSLYFLQADPPVRTAKWWWVDGINEYIPTLFRTWAVLCLPAWLLARKSARYRRWAFPIAFTGLALLLGPGLAVSGIKDLTQRARPFHVVGLGGDKAFTPALQIAQQCNENCAFVSGHTADGFFLVSLMLLSRRRRAWWMAFGVVAGFAIGFARVSVGAHWLSDALWAWPVTMAASWVVWVVLRRWYPPMLPTGEAIASPEVAAKSH